MHSGADACAVRFLWAGGRIERNSIKTAAFFFLKNYFSYIPLDVFEMSLKAPSQRAPTSWETVLDLLR